MTPTEQRLIRSAIAALQELVAPPDTPASTLLREVVDPGLRLLHQLGGPPVTDDARVFLLAVAGQESGWSARYQSSPSDSPGPARGFWQFEQGGGVHGVRTHGASASLVEVICDKLLLVNSSPALWRALEGSAALACCFARLLVLTDPAPIPTNESAAWEYYLDLWRPGKPHPDVWPANWADACEAVAAASWPMV